MWNRRLACLGGIALLLVLAVCAGCTEAAGGGAGRSLAKRAAEWLQEPAPVHKDLALYAGQYGPVAQASDVNQNDNQNNNQNDRMWHNIELEASGRLSGGGSSWEPAAISYQPDGTIRLEISEDEFFTIYPEGLAPQMFASVLDSVAVKLEYTDFRGGVLQVLYYRFE